MSLLHNPLRDLGYCAMARLYKQAARRLYETAQSQQGFFTTKQAIRGGLAEKTTPTTSRQATGSGSIAAFTGSPISRLRSVRISCCGICGLRIAGKFQKEPIATKPH